MKRFRLKFKTFLQKVWLGIEKAFKKLDNTSQKLVPVAIEVTNAVKTIIEKGTFTGQLVDTLTDLIPGELDDKIVGLGRQHLPMLLIKLTLVDQINQKGTLEEKCQLAIEQVRLFDDDQKELFYDGLAKKLLQYLSDGKLTWNEVGYLVKWWYDNKK
jgi:hypothetical protein